MAFKMKGSSYKMGGHRTKATMRSPMKVAGGVYLPGEGTDYYGEQVGKEDQAKYEENQKRLDAEYKRLKKEGKVDMASWLDNNPAYNNPLVKTGFEREGFETKDDLLKKLNSLGSGGKAFKPEDKEEYDRLLKVHYYEQTDRGMEETKKQKRLDRMQGQ